MGAAIETVTMNRNSKKLPGKEVTCIFCGLPTPVPPSDPSKFRSHVPRHISIIRCRVCGKEAPYRTCDIFDFGKI